MPIRRAIQFILDGHIVLQKIQPTVFEKMLASLLKLMDPDSAVTVLAMTEEEKEHTQRTASKMSRRVKKDVRPLLERHQNPETRLDIEDWIAALEITANRGGLLACGSLQVAGEFILRQEGLDPAEAPGGIRQLVRESSALQDLLLFGCSPEYLGLRVKMVG